MFKNMPNHNKAKSLGGALLIGLALGAVAGLLAAPKKGKELRGDIVDKLKDLASSLDEGKGELAVKLKRIFGVVSKETAETYGRIKGEVIAALSTTADELKPGEYEAIVDKMIKKAHKKFNLAKDSVAKLKDEIMRSLKK